MRNRVRDIWKTTFTAYFAFLNHHRPQVFLPQCLTANYLGGAIAGQAGLPWALSMRSDDPVYWAIAETLLPETKGGLIVGVSDHICRLAKDKHLATRTFTVPSGTSIPTVTASFSDAPFQVAFSGRVIEEQKTDFPGFSCHGTSLSPRYSHSMLDHWRGA